MYTRPVEPMRSVASSRGGSHGKSATQKGGRFQPQARGADGGRGSPPGRFWTHSPVPAALGPLPTDATFMTGRFERQTGVAESFAPHVLQGKGFLLCTQFVHPFRGLMRDSRFP